MSILLLFLVALTLHAQSPSADLKSACEKRAQEVLLTLGPVNSLRYALEGGQRGDCIHQPWMDNMRRLGVKQASFLIEYSWKHDKLTFKIESITYFQSYYSDSDHAIKERSSDHAIKGRGLRDIQRSGLEHELSETVLARVRKELVTTHHPGQAYKEVFEANVLDDESLPVIDRIF